ncbi:MAG: LCP family protein [Chloroflexi bacterium]|nr:LCP family protein [Chloroflexota bacterium]
MGQRFDDFHLPPPPPPDQRRGGFSPRHALLSFAFATFVLGGFSFGWLFLANWKILLTFNSTPMTVKVPGGPSISVPAPPGVAVQPRPTPHVVVPNATPAAVAAAESEPTIDIPEWKGAKRLNILLLGIDHRDDEPLDGSRSDTIMVVSIDPISKSAVMVSLPRDLWVSIPGYYNQRINVAHAVGGPDLTAATVKANFGISIDHYARVDFRGFEQMVDAAGGVIVDVERPVKDDEYPTEDYGVMRLYFPPGPVLLDGHMALQYARSRHSENDFGRAARQQRVLIALRDRALQLNMIAKLPTLIPLAQKAVSTDIGIAEMTSLAGLGWGIQRDRIKSLVVDAALSDPFVGPNGEDLLMPRRADIQRAIVHAFNEASGQTAKLEVLNGTIRPGLAKQAADRLAGAGYEVVRIADADRTDYQDTTIEVLTGNERAASVLATRLKLPPSAIKVTPLAGATADIRIVLGRTYTP